MKTCPSCGKQCDDSSAFCGFCGFPLADVPSTESSTDNSSSKPQQSQNVQQQSQNTQPNQYQPNQYQPNQYQPTQNQPNQYQSNQNQPNQYQSNQYQANQYQPNQNQQGYYQNNQQQYNNYQPNNQQYQNTPQQVLKTDGFSLSSLVLGIVGIVFTCCYGFGIIPGVIAFIFGILGKKRCLNANGSLKGLSYAKAGFIMGLIVSIISFIIIISEIALLIFGTSSYMDDFTRDFNRGLNESYYGIFQSIISMIK